MSAEENIKSKTDTDDGPKTMSQDDISNLIAELSGNKEEDAETADGGTEDEPQGEASGDGSSGSEPDDASEIEITEADRGADEADADDAVAASGEQEDGDAQTALDDSDGPKTMSQDDISSLIAELSGKDEAEPPPENSKEAPEAETKTEELPAVEKAVSTPEKEKAQPLEQEVDLEPELEVEKPRETVDKGPAPEPDNKAPEKRAPDNKAPEKRVPEKRVPDKKVSDEKVEPAAAGPETQADVEPGEKSPPEAETAAKEASQEKEGNQQTKKAGQSKSEKADESKTEPGAVENLEHKEPLKEKDPGQVKSEKIKAEIDALLETSKSKPKKSRKKLLAVVFSVVFIVSLVGAAGYYFLYFSPIPEGVTESALSSVPVEDTIKVIPTKVIKSDDGSEKTVFEFEVEEPVQILGGKLAAAMNLRDELLMKNTEIEGLKQYYRGGISDMENEIREKIVQGGIASIKETRRHPDIQYLLKVIQRRQAYIKGLDAPSRWVEYGGEELLYIHRKAEIAVMMKDLISGINLDEVQAEITDVINKYQMDSDSLGMEPPAADLESIEAIWKRIYAQSRNKNNKSDELKTTTAKRNRAIWVEICGGNYDRKYELTDLSPSAAKCLAKSNESDLFLNNINRLSPEAADYLLEWKGNWLCLNGFKELNPGMAGRLSRWDGNWISLNGVTDINVDAARKLSEWPGRQIELMGLKYSAGRTRLAALKHLAKWKNNGGKLYVPGKIEQQIDKMLAQE